MNTCKLITSNLRAILVFLTIVFSGSVSAEDAPLISSRNNGHLLSFEYFPEVTGVSSSIRQFGMSPNGNLLISIDRNLIEFDGAKWKKVKEGWDFQSFCVCENNDLVYSSHGRIWRVKNGEFGKENETELTKNVSVEEWPFLGVLRLYESNDIIYAFDGNRILKITPDNTHRIIDLGQKVRDFIVINKKFYVIITEPDAVKVFKLLDTDETISHEPAFTIENDQPGALSSAGKDGIWWLGGYSGMIYKLSEEGAFEWYQFSDETFALSVTEDNFNRLIIGTQGAGILILDEFGNVIDRIEQSSGLASDRVPKLFVDGTNGLWVESKNSLQYFTLDQQSVTFNQQHGLDGEVLSLHQLNGTLYVGTDQGLYQSIESDIEGLRFEKIPNTTWVSWIDSIDDTLLFLDTRLICYLNNSNRQILDDIDSGFAIVGQHSNNKNWVFYKAGDELNAATLTRSGEWRKVRNINNGAGKPLSFAEDDKGWIWMLNKTGQVSRIKRLQGQEFRVDILNQDQGVPTVLAIPVVIEGHCYLGCPEMKTWNESTQRFETTDEYQYYAGHIPFGFEHIVKHPSSSTVWVAPSRNQGNLLKRPHEKSIQAIVTTGHNIDTRATALLWESETVAWIGSKELILFDESKFRQQVHEPNAAFTQEVRTFKNNELLYRGQTPPETLILDYSQRSIQLEVSLNDFPSMGFVRFSMRLEGIAGLEKAFEDWSEKNNWELINLTHGRYSLLLRAHDASGNDYQTEFNILVKPPFYRTVSAYLIYIVTFFFLIFFIVGIRTRRLEYHTKRLEHAVADRTEKITLQADLLRIQNEQLNRAKKQSDAFAQKATKAAESKSRFLANMSHEIRNPINAVVAMCSLMRHTELDSHQRRFIYTIERSGQNLMTIIDDILSFSKAESDSLKLEKITFDLTETVDDLLKLFGSIASEKNLEIVVDLDPMICPMRVGDPVRLQQILTNLVSNAVKFTFEGQVTIKISEHNDLPNKLNFIISDTGIGISEEDQKVLFKPFSQVDGSITRRFGGTGLGLAISRRLVNLMGGTITCESELEKGTAFTFSIQLPQEKFDYIPFISCGFSKIIWIDSSSLRRKYVQSYIQHYQCECTVTERIEILADPAILQNQHTLVVIENRLLERFDSFETKLKSVISVLPNLTILELPFQDPNTNTRYLPPHRSFHKPLTINGLKEIISGQNAFSYMFDNYQDEPSKNFEDIEVLVVEDSRENQKIMSLLLAKLGISPDVCSNGLDAVEMVERRNYHLILMDIYMPNMNGFETTQKIRSFQKNHQFQSKIYALTAAVVEFDSEEIRRNQMDGLIAKPIRTSELREVVETTIRDSALLPAE